MSSAESVKISSKKVEIVVVKEDPSLKRARELTEESIRIQFDFFKKLWRLK